MVLGALRAAGGQAGLGRRLDGCGAMLPLPLVEWHRLPAHRVCPVEHPWRLPWRCISRTRAGKMRDTAAARLGAEVTKAVITGEAV